MKHLLFIVALLVIMVSCKKERTQDPNNIPSLQSIRLQLKDSLSTIDFNQIDLEHSISTTIPKSTLKFFRIPFLNKNIKTDFILLKIANDGSFSAGKIFNISKDAEPTQPKTIARFNGKIQILSLKRNLLTASLITNGYVDAFHIKQGNPSSKVEAVEIPLMPEVVVMCYITPDGGGYSYYDYYGLGSFFSGGSSGGGNGGGGSGSGSGMGGSIGGSSYYNNSNPGDSIVGSPHPVHKAVPPVIDDEPILIDYEPVENLTAINMGQYLKCFSNVPDAGATCTIKIMTDIPVDSNPNEFFDWSLGSPGHTFLQLTKTNGSQTVQQNIGFYPITGWKTIIAPTPLDSKFVDNAQHEFNASLSESLTPDKFQGALTHMQYLSSFIKYDIARYNCTDFALEVFNYKRGGNQLTIPMYDIPPGGDAPNGTATPGGLYLKLQEMKKPGSAEAVNITIPGYKGYAGISNGPCN